MNHSAPFGPAAISARALLGKLARIEAFGGEAGRPARLASPASERYDRHDPHQEGTATVLRSEGMEGHEAHRAEGVGLTALSRRQLFGRGGAALGGLAGVGLLDAPSVLGRPRGRGKPRPIPGGFDESFNLVPNDPLVHVLPPGIGFEMSTITDFNGVVGASEIRGTARGSDGSQYSFDTDLRFMRGVYVGLDGRLRQGAFGFI